MLSICIVLCLLFSSVMAHTITVSNADWNKPYYTIDLNGLTAFVKGNTYIFQMSSISGIHPFSVGYRYKVAGGLSGSGYSASSGKSGSASFEVTIPSTYSGTKLKYFCTQHDTMQEDFSIDVVEPAPPSQAPVAPSNAKCETHTTCPSGHVLKAAAATTDCASATCASPTDDNTCCEPGYSFGIVDINLCPDDSPVNVVWAGTHNIQESDSHDCNSAEISVPLAFAGSTTLNGDVGFLGAGTRKSIAANLLSDWESTRFFRCTKHCGSARLRVTCSRANPSPACPSAEYDAKSRKYDPQVRTCPSSPDYVLGSQTDASLQNSLQPLCRCESCETLLSPMVAPDEICHNGQLKERAACDANACKPGSNLKSDAGKCQQETCAPARDHDTCCDAVKCLVNERVQVNACVPCDTNYVNDAGDDATGVNTQCDITAQCSSYTCPLGHASNVANSNEYCEGVACGLDDNTQCCLERAMCSSLNINNCGTGYVTTNPSGLCVGSACDTQVAADFSTCCTPKTCPAGQGYVAATDECEACEDGDPSEWNAVDDQSPCGNHAGCPLRSERFDYKSHTNDTCVACAAGKQTGADAFATTCDPVYCLVNQHVENNKCKACADNYLNDAGDDASKGDTSCTEKEKCDDYTCLSPYLSNTANGGQYCRDATCGLLDRDMCCMQVGKCSSLGACGHGYELNTTASDSNCAGATCEVPADLATCCQSIKCPAGEGYVSATDSCETCTNGANPKFNAHNNQSPCGDHDGCVDRSKRFNFDNDAQGQCIDCAQGKQTAVDKFAATCVDILCNENFHVVNYQCQACPSDYTNAAGDKASDGSTDCDENEKCRDYTCPNGYAQNAENKNKYCTGATCDNSDRDTCCTERAKCPTLQCGKHYLADSTKTNTYCTDTVCKMNDDRDLCCTEKNCPPGQGYVYTTSECETCDAADPPEWNSETDQSPCGQHNGCSRREEYFVYSNTIEGECKACTSGKITSKNMYAFVCDEDVPVANTQARDRGRCGCDPTHCRTAFLKYDRITNAVCSWSNCEACDFCSAETKYDYCTTDHSVVIEYDVIAPKKYMEDASVTSNGRCGCEAKCVDSFRHYGRGTAAKNRICVWSNCERCKFCEGMPNYQYCTDHHEVDIQATEVDRVDGRCGCDTGKCSKKYRLSGMTNVAKLSVCSWTNCEACGFCSGIDTYNYCTNDHSVHIEYEVIERKKYKETPGASDARCGCQQMCVDSFRHYGRGTAAKDRICAWSNCERCKFCEGMPNYQYCTDHHEVDIQATQVARVDDRCGCNSAFCSTRFRKQSRTETAKQSICGWTNCEACGFCSGIDSYEYCTNDHSAVVSADEKTPVNGRCGCDSTFCPNAFKKYGRDNAAKEKLCDWTNCEACGFCDGHQNFIKCNN